MKRPVAKLSKVVKENMSARGRGRGRSNRAAMKAGHDGSKEMKQHPQMKTLVDYLCYLG